MTAIFIEAPELAGKTGIRHAFFTRQGGVSEGIYASLNGGVGSSDDQTKVRENRRRMTEALGVAPDALVSVYQIHSPDVLRVEGQWPGDRPRPKADGMVTNVPGLALGISTADCGPVLFADEEARVIGACHSGWRGAFEGVLEATLAEMEKLGAKRERVTAVLGPMISGEAYEVGPEFVQRFRDKGENESFFRPSGKEGHALFDLPAYIETRLTAAGVGTFANLGLCTYADPERFYSYRRTTHKGEPDYGRLISAIALTR